MAIVDSIDNRDFLASVHVVLVDVVDIIDKHGAFGVCTGRSSDCFGQY